MSMIELIVLPIEYFLPNDGVEQNRLDLQQ